MISVPALEWPAAHSCNFTCEACGSFANYGRKELMSIDQLEQWFLLWNKRISPKRMAVLGGEPFLNKDILGIIELGRKIWHWDSNTYYEIVTNGFLVDKFPELPKVLEKNNCTLNISVHGNSEKYTKKLNKIKHTVSEWQKEYKFSVKFEQYPQWSRGYLGYGEQAIPYEHGDPDSSWKHCPAGQNSFSLMYGNIYKCAPLAYLPYMKEQFPNLSNKWDYYLSYRPLTPECSDNDIIEFYSKGSESYCGMCPSQPQYFEKKDPLIPIRFYQQRQ